MINRHPLFKGLNMRIPMIIPIKGRGFINRGSGLNPEAQAFSAAAMCAASFEQPGIPLI